MSQTDTKTRIMDTAEQLFARDGFHITSLRTLAVNYHFGSKEGLLQAVITRRLLPLDEIRQQKISAVLAQAEAAGKPPSAKDLLNSFIGPTLDFRNSGPGARDFISLIGRSLSEPDETVRKYFIRQVLPTFKLLAAGLQKALPEIPEKILLARLQFALGSMSHMMSSRARPDQMGNSFPAPLADQQMVAELINFVSAGLEAPC